MVDVILREENMELHGGGGGGLRIKTRCIEKFSKTYM